MSGEDISEPPWKNLVTESSVENIMPSHKGTAVDILYNSAQSLFDKDFVRTETFY